MPTGPGSLVAIGGKASDALVQILAVPQGATVRRVLARIDPHALLEPSVIDEEAEWLSYPIAGNSYL